MSTFEQLRSALLDPNSHIALDRLVRNELALGRKTKTIHDELLTHIDALRAMPDTDALEDPLGDTLDALWGWGNPDNWYKDPPIPRV